MNTQEIQNRLSQLGFDPGPSDGAWGRRTRTAVVLFQKSVGIEADGVVGARTTAALRAGKAAPVVPGSAGTEPSWLLEARRWLGLREIAGAASNPKILEWGKAIEAYYVNDDIPWCGVFVHAQLAAALPEEIMISNPMWARGWLKFGVKSSVAPGAILVFARGPTSGHVGFYVGEDATRYRVLGGNQSNAVTETWIEKSRLLGVRWPSTVGLPEQRIVKVRASGSTSVNEA